MFFALRTSPLVLVAMISLLVRGRWLGLPWSLSDTVLTTSLLEAMTGDAATLLALRSDGWGGKWRVQWSSLALEVFPGRLEALVVRMRRLGVAQVAVPLVASILSSIWFLTGNRAWWSHSSMVMLTSLFVLLTTLLPALPRIAAAGSALDRLRAPRWAHANWVWAGALRALDSGATLKDLVGKPELQALLPPSNQPLEPISLLFQTLCCERGDFEDARPLVERWPTSSSTLPAWLAVDGLKQAAAYWALIVGDQTRATELLEHVKRMQLVPWYSELVTACLAHLKGDLAARAEALSVWHAAVDTHPRRQLLLSANRWILEKLV